MYMHQAALRVGMFGLKNSTNSLHNKVLRPEALK